MPTATRRKYFSATGIPLPRIDLRKPTARRFRELVAAFERELEGLELTAADQTLVVAAATITVRQEELRDAIIRGEAVNDTELKGLASEARRIMDTLRARSAKAKPVGDAALRAHLERHYPKVEAS